MGDIVGFDFVVKKHLTIFSLNITSHGKAFSWLKQFSVNSSSDLSLYSFPFCFRFCNFSHLTTEIYDSSLV